MKKTFAAALAAGLLLCTTQGFAGSGSSQYDPILPDFIWSASASGQNPTTTHFVFNNVTNANSGLWYDPPMVEGFVIGLNWGRFTSVTAPEGMNGLQLWVNNQIVDADFNAGETYSFGAGVKSFAVRNINPTLDPASPTFVTALPLKLSFADIVPSATMVWSTLSPAVPESDIYLLMIGGLAFLGLLKHRRR